MTTPLSDALLDLLARLGDCLLHVTFFVPGKCASAGSKNGFYQPKLKRVIMVPANKKSKPWTADVKAYAQIALAGKAPLVGCPVFLYTEFIMTRPKGHFRTGRNAGILKVTAPFWSLSKPDDSKMLRCLEDALTGLAWHDDNQVVINVSTKRYPRPGEYPGAQVSVFYQTAV